MLSVSTVTVTPFPSRILGDFPLLQGQHNPGQLTEMGFLTTKLPDPMNHELILEWPAQWNAGFQNSRHVRWKARAAADKCADDIAFLSRCGARDVSVRFAPARSGSVLLLAVDPPTSPLPRNRPQQAQSLVRISARPIFAAAPSGLFNMASHRLHAFIGIPPACGLFVA